MNRAPNQRSAVPQWWHTAVIYQIYPKSFADANGDGIGDIAGIRSRLGYLAELGVDAIWVSPWYLSPQRDGGYDVTDQREIDPLFGSVADVVALIGQAHALGIKVIADIVPNHTSDRHRYFQEAMSTEPGSRTWARYHCVRGAQEGQAPPNDWESAFGGPAWDPVLDADGHATGWWFLHIFDSSQPDLNWDHPEVHAEFAETLRFWFAAGIDGFRVDVATGLTKAPGYPSTADWLAANPSVGRYRRPYWDQPEVHAIWREWRAIADEFEPPRIFVGEVWVDSAQAHAAYLRPDEFQTAFNFEYLLCPWDAARLRESIDASIHQCGLVGAPTTWALENHDVPRARTRFGLDAAGSVSDRHERPDVEPIDEVGLARARAAMLFMLGLPGSAYIYQGQELGLAEVMDLPDDLRQDPAFARTDGISGLRDGCRVPMPWMPTGDSLGFSDSGASWLPQPANWSGQSVAAQAGDPASMLELTKGAIALRRGRPEMTEGGFAWLDSPEPEVLIVGRPDSTEPNTSSLAIAINMGSGAVELPASEVLLASGATSVGRLVDGQVTLAPDEAAWLVL